MVCMHEEDSRELPHMSSLFLEARPRLCPPLLASLSTYQHAILFRQLVLVQQIILKWRSSGCAPNDDITHVIV